METIVSHLEQSCRGFHSAKNILESDQVKQIPQVCTLLNIAKNNLVVTRILAESLHKEVRRAVRFDFTAHPVFPMVKFAS